MTCGRLARGGLLLPGDAPGKWCFRTPGDPAWRAGCHKHPGCACFPKGRCQEGPGCACFPGVPGGSGAEPSCAQATKAQVGDLPIACTARVRPPGLRENMHKYGKRGSRLAENVHKSGVCGGGPSCGPTATRSNRLACRRSPQQGPRPPNAPPAAEPRARPTRPLPRGPTCPPNAQRILACGIGIVRGAR